MTKSMDILQLYDNYGLRRLLEEKGRRPLDNREAVKFRKWLKRESKQGPQNSNPHNWLLIKASKYLS